MKFARRRISEPRRDGCGYVVLTCVFSCLFLVLNSALLTRMYPVLAEYGPSFLENPRVIQAIMFIGPVILIFFEWWFVDLVVDLLTPGRRFQQR
jgi:hypothetical protein